MSDYSKLVKALRHCTDNEPSNGDCWNCPYQGEKCHTLLSDAADAIEALQATVSKLEERTKAQQERLEDYMEKQLIIDRWGAKWMTSAKDVPTAAYEHGYADGRDEAEAQLPKRGEIVRCRECRWGTMCVTGQHLGLDGFCSKGEREVQE